ncbi:MAG: DUF86 domain-containing protein [Planctomycetes bacterium]|jgi:uncharacterized protein with HEPN domain|nr:DUF86 domain-containing protein [Planctomycetota bacterium]
MNRDRLYLVHMREAIQNIMDYTVGGRDAFMSDRKTRDAVVRNFEIIGEATKRLSDGVKSTHPEVRWRDVAGFRDILIHVYEGVDYVEVWNIVANHLPGLRDAVDSLLAS